MRIVCQKCAAAYAIDDRLISPRGVRAQCPRCRTQQLVKPGDPGAPRPPPAVTPVATPAIPPEAFKEGPQPSPKDAPAPPLPPPPVPPSVPALTLTLSQREREKGGDLSQGEREKREAARASEASRALTLTLSQGEREKGGDLSQGERERGGDFSQGEREKGGDLSQKEREEPAGERDASACTSCGKRLDDPFDVALGSCDACRAAEEPATEMVTAPGMATAPPPPPPVPSTPLMAGAGVMSARREGARSGGGRGKVLGLIAVALLALAAVGWFFQDTLRGLVASAGGTADPQATDAVTEIAAGWRARLGSPERTAQAHVEEGTKLLAEDHAQAYEDAARHFQRALAQDSSLDAAVAGYVTALSLGRDDRLGDEGYAEALRLVEAALSRSGRAAPLLVAHAHLLLTRPEAQGHLEQAQALAKEAVEKAGENAKVKAAAHLAAGRATLRTSSALAEQSLNAALDLDPDLKVARHLRALARERVNDDVGAEEDLRWRLQQEPQHWASLQALSRIMRQTGREAEARALLQGVSQSGPDALRARVALAVHAYQVDGAAKDAAAKLGAMTDELSQLEPSEQRAALVHLAAAQRLTGNAQAAQATAERALAQSPKDPAAHLQLFLLALQQGQTKEALTHHEALGGALGDAALEKYLLGRAYAADRRFQEAEAQFLESVSLDERRTDARLWAGYAAAADGRREAALRHLHQAALADPWRPLPTPMDPLLAVNPTSLLRGATDHVAALRGDGDDVLPALYEAVLRFHLGEHAAAQKLTAQVVAVDSGNALAHAYRSLSALRQGDTRGARQAAERAEQSGRRVALAHFALGVVAARAGDGGTAQRSLAEAQRLDRSLLGAELELALLAAKANDAQNAQARLRRVVTLDPSWSLARAKLYEVSKGAAR